MTDSEDLSPEIVEGMDWLHTRLLKRLKEVEVIDDALAIISDDCVYAVQEFGLCEIDLLGVCFDLAEIISDPKTRSIICYLGRDILSDFTKVELDE